MGHERVPVLPRSKSWQKIVTHISQIYDFDVSIPQIANATLQNVRKQFGKLHRDEGVKSAFIFLLALSTSSSKDKPESKSSLPHVDLTPNPSPLQLAVALRKWIFAHRQSFEYADIAQKSATDAIALWTEREKQQPSLFDKANNASQIWRKANTGRGFCEVARLFFSKFTERYLNYFLEREASSALSNIDDREKFSLSLKNYVDAISKHAFETAKITQSFAAGWFNKYAHQQSISKKDVEDFLWLSFGKIREELWREVSNQE
jgi:hypothetical protein